MIKGIEIWFEFVDEQISGRIGLDFEKCQAARTYELSGSPRIRRKGRR